MSIIWLAAAFAGFGLSVTVAGSENGIVNVPSNHSVDETVQKLKNILESKGIALFALIDHSGEAEGWNDNASHEAVDLWKP